jgi:ATP-dependent helicase/nuclease subunit A
MSVYNPTKSIWVSASAGTGKTWLLVQRILTLLVTNPNSKILAITFTKAAANEMIERVHKALKDWQSSTDEELITNLGQILAKKPTEQHLMTARNLLSLMCNGSFTLTIQTIHAFCQEVLLGFGHAINVTPNFSILNNDELYGLVNQAKDNLINNITPEIESALKVISLYIKGDLFDELLFEIIQERYKIYDIIAGYTSLDELYTNIINVLEAINLPILTATYEEAQNAITVLRSGTETEKKRADIISKGIESYDFEIYKTAFVTQEGSPSKTIITKKTAERYPDVASWLLHEQERILEAIDKRKSFQTAESTISLFKFIVPLLKEYEKLKQEANMLDYNDLIELTYKLLNSPEHSEWVLYNLSYNIDHILLDEAQDTNLRQWRILDRLTDEFFVGEGANKHNKTLFVVGDDKQSIFSFQGASHLSFAYMRHYFNQKANNSFYHHTLGVSYRSAPVILNLVNNFLNSPDVQDKVSIDLNAAHHSSSRIDATGNVEVWPLINADDIDQPNLPEKIASTIKDWLDTQRILSSKSRPIQAGDIMILVQRRNELTDQILAALNKYAVPNAGIDRLSLNNYLAIKDLLALGKFITTPNYDFNLACLLKSPIIGLTENELFKLAYDRQDKSIWQKIQNGQGDVYTKLQTLQNIADKHTPYTFYYHLLKIEKLEYKFACSIGNEVYEILDAFLNAIYDYEEKHLPSWSQVLSWFESNQIEIKRDTAHSADYVRIMTAHGAKGLQAPIVILPDTTSVYTSTSKLLFDEANNLLFWPGRANNTNKLCERIKSMYKEGQHSENLRLLYVALTRAEDELIICGQQTRNTNLNPNCWYSLVRSVI